MRSPQELDALATELGIHGREASHVATRLVEALDKSRLQRRTRRGHYNWDGLGGCHRGSHRRRKMSDDHSDIVLNKFGGKFSSAIASPLRVADVKLKVVPFRVA